MNQKISFFGMEMKMEFIQPRNGMAGPHGDQEMEFAFAGDDDIWVFVDGKLFLDLSGIHRHCGGTINFKEGTVSYFDFDPDIGDVSPDPYKVVPFEDVLGTTDGLFYDNNKGEYTTFKTFSTHKFEFYYMERGAGSGMCRMYFNMPLREENSMAVTKYLEVDDGDIEELLGDQEFAFQILNAGTETPYITEGITYTIQDAYGNEVCKKQTEPNGLFRVKATQTAVFSELESSDESYYVRELIRDDFQSQYGKVEVNGDIKTSYSYVTLDDEAFVGFESNEKNLADGNSSFAFANHVIKEKTGKLIITKELKNSDSKTDEFMVEIKFDGTPIQKGYIYHLTQCDGTSVIRTVTDEGIVIIKPGESILLENILLGSEFTVQEVGSYVDGYSISYHGDCTETILNDYEAAKGQMLASETLQVDIVNAESSGKILIQKDIPADQIYKTADGTVVGLFKISGTDLRGNKHTYVREVRMDSIDGDVASGTAVIESVPFGTYTVQEIETGRYKQSGLAVNDSSNMTVSMSSSQKKITVKSDSIRRKYNGFAHACIVKNSIKK